MKIVDARGKSCPQPVIMTRKIISDRPDEVEVIVDNKVASGNVKRLLEKMGYKTSTEEKNDLITVRGNISSNNETVLTSMKSKDIIEKGNLTILISREIIGGNDRELGEVLIKSFLGTLVQMEFPPRYISLMNEGIRLALKGTSTCDYLQELERKGCEILVCGTCTNHFGVTEEVGVGVISNMFDITESLMKVDKVISI